MTNRAKARRKQNRDAVNELNQHNQSSYTVKVSQTPFKKR